MLAAIDPTGGGATSNAQLITLNFQRAVKAVATLAAGSATPTVNAIIASNTQGNGIILSTSNTNLAIINPPLGTVATSIALQGATVYGLSGTPTISSVLLANTTGAFTLSTSNLNITAISSGNIEPGMAAATGTFNPNNWVVGQLTVNATATPATLATTFNGTSGQNIITISSNTGITAGLFIANTTGGAITGIATGTYVGAFYANGTAYAGNTTVPLKTFANVDVTLGASFSANGIAFFTGGKTGIYQMGVNNLAAAQTVTSLVGYKLSNAQPATSTAFVNAVAFSTNNCVALISNTEAGGWSVSSNSTTADSFSGANATVGAALLDLYVQNTNKASYPFHKIAIRQNPSVAFSNATYATFNYIYFYHGASASNGYSDATFSAFTGPSAIVNQRTTPTATLGYGYPLANTGDFPCLLAVTNSYMHVISNTGIVSMGYRETATWEDSYSDNPPVYNFSIDTRTYTTSNHYPASSFMYGRSISNTGTFNAAARYQYAYTATAAVAQPNPVSGVQMNTTTAVSAVPGSMYSARQGFTSGPSSPLFYLSTHSDSATYMSFYPPGYDSANATFVPSAYPVVMQLNRPGFYNAGGKANGIFKSISGGNSTGISLSYYYTANATYSISGVDYYPALAGGIDLFLIRKA
jgi:hypothetical protein